MGPPRDHRTDTPGRPRWHFPLGGPLAAVAAGAVGFGLLRLPGVGGLVVVLLMAVGGTLAILVATMGLGWLGFGLVALFHRSAARARSQGNWPDPSNDPWADPTEPRGG